MQWYFFTLSNTRDNFQKENRIIELLGKLILKFNKGKRKDTLLLYQIPSNLNYIIYYITSPRKEIIKFFIRHNKARPCFHANNKAPVKLSNMKFLSGDVILWLNLLGVHK